MGKAHATAEVFLTALRAMPGAQRKAVVSGIARDKAMRRDLMDLAVLAERRHEPSRPIREYLAEKRGR